MKKQKEEPSLLATKSEQPQLELVDTSTGELTNIPIRKHKTWLTYTHIRNGYEKNDGKGRTVPNQALSIEEIILRTQRGYPVDETYTTFYNGEDDDLPDLRRLDITQLHELKKWADDKIKEGESFMQKQYDDYREKKNNEFYQKKFEKEEAAKKATQPAPSAGRSEPLTT